MAAVAIMRTYFWFVINVSAETSRTIIDQGLDEFDSLVEFTEADMKTLCTTIRRPGGMIINPRANISDQPPTICDPDHLIYMVAEKRLLMTAYAAMHQTRTLIPIDSKSMNRVLIISLAAIPEQELSYNEPQAIYNPLKDTLMSKWLESIDDYLLKFWGVNKCPLSYVARTQISVKPHATDPDTNYEKVDQEMTPQAPHVQCIYCAENKTLWYILHDAIKDHP